MQRVAIACALLGVVLVLGYRVGNTLALTRATDALQARFGKNTKVEITSLRLGWGKATLRGISIVDEPLGNAVAIQTLQLEMPMLAMLRSKVSLESMHGSHIQIHLATAPPQARNKSPRLPATDASVLPPNVTFDNLSVLLSDQSGRQAELLIGSGSIATTASRSFSLHNVQTSLRNSTRLQALADANQGIDISGHVQRSTGGYEFSLTTTYAQHSSESWTMAGSVAANLNTANVSASFRNTQLHRIRALISNSPVGLEDHSRLHGTASAILTNDSMRITADLAANGLTLDHPAIASQPLHDLQVRTSLSLQWLRAANRWTLAPSQLIIGDSIPLNIEGSLTLQAQATPATLQLAAHMPPTPCGQVLSGFPPELIPALAGFRAEGLADASIDVAIDWSKLDDLELSTRVNLQECNVVETPPKFSETGLAGSLTRITPNGERLILGRKDPEYTPLVAISQNLIDAVTFTEDPTFFTHDGFGDNYRVALIKNLQAGSFAWGGSSITNQMVKNVFLSPEKNLSRKLQEAILTWHVERTMSKNRILELYLNAIEYGPELFGVKQAARQYFHTSPSGLNLIQSAFLAKLLPAPTQRVQWYCGNHLKENTIRRMELLVDAMWYGRRIEEERYIEAQELVLEFPIGLRRSKYCDKIRESS